MIVAIAAALLLQAAAPPAADTVSPPRGSRAPRVPVTGEHVRTAFGDSAARELFERAREARLRQDTSLVAYDATSYSRISAGLGAARLAATRLLGRSESAVRVRWHRSRGALVEILGRREVSPADGQIEPGAGGQGFGLDDPFDILPWYPGRETLWMGSSTARADVSDRGPVHPLAHGAEAYYTYHTGDSVAFRLPNGRTVALRELRIRPRSPKWNLAVGSLWFDVESAQIVRSVYRLAVPAELWDVLEDVEPEDVEDVPAAARRVVPTMRGTVSAVMEEYALFEEQFWLPRTRRVEAELQIAFARIPLQFEQRHEYASVSGSIGTPSEVPALDSALRARALGDSAWLADSLASLPPEERTRAHRRRHAALERRCGADGMREAIRERANGAVRAIVRMPCDTMALITSAALPPSIYDAGDVAAAPGALEQLEEALTIDAQAVWRPQPASLQYGFTGGWIRFNRVEGLAPGVGAEIQLGRGYVAHASARLGLAAWSPTAELGLSRSDGRRTLGGTIYRRLSVANDWGDPLGFGNSLSALLLGRDDGLYYSAWGVELTADGRARGWNGGRLSWRAFSERHDVAEVETNASLYTALSDGVVPPNIRAEPGSITGVAGRFVRSFGVDPRGLRATADLRGEMGVGSFAYGRALGDLTLTHALGRRGEAALSLGTGSTLGTVPVQRRFHLGGPHSIRGQDPGAVSGESFWMARAELAGAGFTSRPSIFYDLGWAGARDAWRHPGRVASGAGVGLSFLQGLARLDLSRGVAPARQWRVDLYVGARF